MDLHEETVVEGTRMIEYTMSTDANIEIIQPDISTDANIEINQPDMLHPSIDNLPSGMYGRTKYLLLTFYYFKMRSIEMLKSKI